MPSRSSSTESAFATDPGVIAEQADMVATAWSPLGAPASWALTAAQFATLRDDHELLAQAATIPADRLPPLLFSAAATSLTLELEPEPLRSWFPRLGAPQPPLDARRFGSVYREFCLEHRERLQQLCRSHRYQMNEVGRCSGLIPALAGVTDERPLALVDVGTGAGLALHLDHYRYRYTRPGDGGGASWGARAASAVIETELRGAADPALPADVPRVLERIGIDVEPLDVGDPSVRSWLAACIPQEIGAVTRFHSAVELMLAEPVRTVRGDAVAVLPDVLAGIAPEALICVLDTYVAVFFEARELQAFRAVIDAAGTERDLDWISIDPLVPMGTAATDCVTGATVPGELLERNRDQGVFGVVSRVSYRGGVCTRAVLGFAHPSAAWLQWLE